MNSMFNTPKFCICGSNLVSLFSAAALLVQATDTGMRTKEAACHPAGTWRETESASGTVTEIWMENGKGRETENGTEIETEAGKETGKETGNETGNGTGNETETEVETGIETGKEREMDPSDVSNHFLLCEL